MCVALHFFVVIDVLPLLSKDDIVARPAVNEIVTAALLGSD